MPPSLILTPETFDESVAALTAADPDLARVVARRGPPPFWRREPGFSTLIHIVLEQQVSLASARAAFDRLAAVVPRLDPEGFLTLDDETLRRVGFSRQKAGYCRGLARALASGELDLDALEEMPDDQARAALTRVKGIGRWSADVYLLMALRRPDVWPAGDLALAVAAKAVKGLDERPAPRTLDDLGEPWRPFRAVAARILWHEYLSERGRAG